MDKDRIVSMSLLLLAAILAAMNPTFLRLHVHVYPAPPSDSRDAQLHTFALTLPPAPPRSGRLIATDGSSRHTPSQGISPAPRGTGGLSNCCEADRGGVMPRTDVEGGECATHEAVANSSYVEQTVRVEKRALEASGSAKNNAIPQLHGDASYAPDLQRADVAVQPGETLAESDNVVHPPRQKVPRRRFHPHMSSGNAGSSRAGSNR